MDKLLLFYNEAKNKVTVYVGLFIASAAEIRANWPDLASNLPSWHWLQWGASHFYVGLGLLVIYTRVRRALSANLSAA